MISYTKSTTRLNKYIFKGLSFVLTFAVVFQAFAMAACAEVLQNETGGMKKTSSVSIYGFERANTYDSYISRYNNASQPDKVIMLPVSEISSIAEDIGKVEQEYCNKKLVLVWKKNTGYVEWSFNIEQEGLYNVEMEYCPVLNTGWNLELGLEVNGKIPFDEAMRFTFSRMWKDDGEVKQDSRGNDVRPGKIEVEQWRNEYFSDADGRHNDPFLFYFEKGRNTIRISGNKTGFALAGLKIHNLAPIPAYAEYQINNPFNDDKINDIKIIIDGESPYLTSDTTLYGMYDRSSAATQPSHPSKLRINTIGQNNWRSPGQWITWKFNVPEDGMYKIDIRARQNYVRGFFSTREILIDGKVPFEELKYVRFPYSSQWYINTLGDKQPFMFYLQKGYHEITLKAVPGEVANVVRELEDAVYKLNYIYRKIIMITGVAPDPYRDYKLEDEIPDLLKSLEEVSLMLDNGSEKLEHYGVRRGSDASILNKTVIQLKSFYKKPDTIALRLNDYKSNVSAISSWLLSLKEQPLEIDYIQVSSPDVEKPNANADILTQGIYKIRAFLGSFVENYSMVGNTYESRDAIDVWIATGRDQAQALKDLIDNEFVKQYGVSVNLSLVQQGLIEATLAGKGPDIALMIGNGDPVNFAARGALVDLSGFKNFDEVQTRFAGEAFTPYMFMNGCYALPVQQSFYMMFYRKDILSELGINPPSTWKEFYDIVPIIQRNNMQIGITNMNTTLGSAGLADNGIFDTLLFQRGGHYFNSDQSKTDFESRAALDSFKQWTGFYTKYRFPMTFDFYNRFRTGEIPLGIQGYTMYNLLSVAAPEIRNLWDMEPVPGTERPDGTLDRSVAGSGTAAVMFNKIKDREAGWKFLSWFTSAEVQSKFGRTLESLMGPAGRYDTANLEALPMLPWSQKESDKLLVQLQNIRCAPQSPASYYLYRNLTNAFRAVVMRWENPREMVYLYNKEINKEILRKRIELGID